MFDEPGPLLALAVDDITPVAVCEGIVRRDLPTTPFARAWVIDFAPGSEWPAVDNHAAEERYFVVSGEVIEGDTAYGPGTYVMFPAHSRHRPRSVVGARMLGINEIAP